MPNARSTVFAATLLMATTLTSNPTREELTWCLARARAPRLRTMLEFAEQEIVIPDGPFPGRRFRGERQPFSELALQAMDPLAGDWNRIVATGPTQTGKTLLFFVLPICYHLFEIGETVVVGVPHMEMAGDKWRQDLLPIIERTRYRELLPRSGGGSRGGKVEAIRFRNGATLRFMSGGGGDKHVAGFTTRVVVITETDGMDQAGSTSREADRITQLEARTRAFGRRKRIYLECTVSIELGRTWQEYQKGTRSRIMLPCPRCRAYVAPEREHLVGWQDAESEIEARELAYFACPECGERWSEEDREAANRAGVLVHRGQEITPEGRITGEPPQTDTLGFRWSAVNNLFVTAGDVGGQEWVAQRATDDENAEKEMRQFVWCLPWESPAVDLTPLDPEKVRKRFGRGYPKGLVPEDTEHLTAGFDVMQRFCYWLMIAWRPEARGHIVDYGAIDVPSDDLGIEAAVMLTLRDFRDRVMTGWTHAAGGVRVPDQVWIDARWQGPADRESDVVYEFIRETRDHRFRPYLGCGLGDYRSQAYRRPKKVSKQSGIRFIGEGYHVEWLRDKRVFVVKIDTNAWKTNLQDCLRIALEQPGAITVYDGTANEHISLSKQLTAEKPQEVFVPGKGPVKTWVRVSRSNHALDAGYAACAAGHLCGVRRIGKTPGPAPTGPAGRVPLTTPDGRPFLVTERS